MQVFATIIGQNNAVNVLVSALNSDKIAHAYLFTGPSGVGKRMAAEIFARGINCASEVGTKPCDICLSCKKALHKNHPDINFLEPEGASIKIEQIRKLQKQVYAKAYEGRYKIFILEDMHKATVQACNSLLKILEEPPDNVVFILLTENLQSIPATVISRCQKINFVPLSKHSITQVLQAQGHSVEKVQLAADLAGGSLGQAWEVLNNEKLVSVRKYALNFLESVMTKKYFRIFKVIEEIDKAKVDIQALLQQILLLLRDDYVVSVGEQTGIIANREIIDKLENIRGDRIGAMNTVVSIIEMQQKQANNRLLLDVLGLRLAQLV